MNTDMCKGNPFKVILFFFIPMFIGNLFQQIYNVVDSIIVARFINSNAFAAVGSCFLIMNFLTSILIGLSLGCSAYFAQLYGAKDYKNLKKAIATSLIFVMGISVLLSVGCLLFINHIIVIFQMPIETIEYSKTYLMFIFVAMFFTGLYNYGAFILRSLGDSKTPLYFLVIGCIVHIILDLIFVLVFHWSVAGVGFATLLSQGITGILCAIYTYKKTKFLKFEKSDFKYDHNIMKNIVTYSTLTAFQQSISTFGMMLIQGLVNTFGTITMSAYAACSKIDEFANRPLQDLANASSTFVAQNHGANKQDRVISGFRATIKLVFAFSIVISILVYAFAPNLIMIFIDKSAVDIIEIGVKYLRVVSLFYIMLGLIVTFYAFFRGYGQVKVSVFLTIISQAIRVILAFILAKTVLGFEGISIAIVIGWTISSGVGYYCYRKRVLHAPTV